MKFEKVILASQSPRRSQLLQWAEIPFEVAFVETDESYPEHLAPSEIAIHIALNKAVTVKKNINHLKTNGHVYPILSADTIVLLENKILGKPSGRSRKNACYIVRQDTFGYYRCLHFIRRKKNHFRR